MAIRERIRKDGIRVYDVEFRTADGRKVRECAGTTRTQAKRKHEQRIGEVRAGTYVNPREERRRAKAEKGPTFEDFADQFMRDYGGLRRSDHYAVCLAPARAFFAGRYLRELRREDLDLYGAERARKVGPSTVRKNLTALATVFRLAVRWGALAASPAVDLDKPREPHHRTRFLTPDEWHRLHETAEPWLRPILAVAVGTGMRLKEVVSLRWEDVDRAAGLLYVSEDNKTGEPRAVPLGESVKRTLDGITRRIRSPFVFVDGTGEPRTGERERNRITQRTKAAAKRAGLAEVSFHTLRHTAGSWAAQAGATQLEIARLLGHASTATTERYTHLTPSHLRATMHALDAALSDGVETPAPTSEENAEEAEAESVASQAVAAS